MRVDWEYVERLVRETRPCTQPNVDSDTDGECFLCGQEFATCHGKFTNLDRDFVMLYLREREAARG